MPPYVSEAMHQPSVLPVRSETLVVATPTVYVLLPPFLGTESGRLVSTPPSRLRYMVALEPLNGLVAWVHVWTIREGDGGDGADGTDGADGGDGGDGGDGVGAAGAQAVHPQHQAPLAPFHDCQPTEYEQPSYTASAG